MVRRVTLAIGCTGPPPFPTLCSNWTLASQERFRGVRKNMKEHHGKRQKNGTETILHCGKIWGQERVQTEFHEGLYGEVPDASSRSL